nr:MAG TPA: hypothetical protein [Caudoviricetes sp.]
MFYSFIYFFHINTSHIDITINLIAPQLNIDIIISK